MGILLTDRKKISLIVEYAKSGSNDVADLVDSTAKAQVKNIAEWLVDLPTDGYDKWYFYHQDLAKDLLKEVE